MRLDGNFPDGSFPDWNTPIGVCLPVSQVVRDAIAFEVTAVAQEDMRRVHQGRQIGPVHKVAFVQFDVLEAAPAVGEAERYRFSAVIEVAGPDCKPVVAVRASAGEERPPALTGGECHPLDVDMPGLVTAAPIPLDERIYVLGTPPPPVDRVSRPVVLKKHIGHRAALGHRHGCAVEIALTSEVAVADLESDTTRFLDPNGAGKKVV